MKNITLSLNEDLIKSCRKYARDQHTSLNALIRSYLEKIANGSNENQDWLDEAFDLMDQMKLNTKGEAYKREELYDV